MNCKNIGVDLEWVGVKMGFMFYENDENVVNVLKILI